MKTQAILFVTLILSLSSCKLVDLRTTAVKDSSTDSEQKGKVLLDESVKAMGYDRLANIETYEALANFKWKFPWSTVPMNSFPGTGRSGKKTEKLRFIAGNFDGSIEYLNGAKKGNVYGIQSWQGYQQKEGKELTFKKDKKRTWGLGTWHYLLEAPYRLQSAQIIKYAGTETFEGVEYERVFVTWGTESANEQFDQFLVYINPTTKHIDLVHVTIRDFYMPMPNNMAHGTIRYAHRDKTSEGIWMPTSMVFQITTPKKMKKYVYKAELSEFKFNTFSKSLLQPNQALEDLGDNKPQ